MPRDFKQLAFGRGATTVFDGDVLRVSYWPERIADPVLGMLDGR